MTASANDSVDQVFGKKLVHRGFDGGFAVGAVALLGQPEGEEDDEAGGEGEGQRCREHGAPVARHELAHAVADGVRPGFERLAFPETIDVADQRFD